MMRFTGVRLTKPRALGRTTVGCMLGGLSSRSPNVAKYTSNARNNSCRAAEGNVPPAYGGGVPPGNVTPGDGDGGDDGDSNGGSAAILIAGKALELMPAGQWNFEVVRMQ